jgi:hypothetical protein
MSSTVVSAVNRGTFTIADWTIMPKKGVFKDYLDRNPELQGYLAYLSEHRQEQKRIQRGFQIQNPDDTEAADAAASGVVDGKEIEASGRSTKEDTEHDLARQLAITIKSVAHDLRANPPKRYGYEQWVNFTKLIRFSRGLREELEKIEEEEGLVEWDWIGEDSPMLADITEAEWVLDRLCESLHRYTQKQAGKVGSLNT